MHGTGPISGEPPAADVEPPPGTEPLVLVAPSTSKDLELRLVRAALRGLAGLPVRVLATANRPLPSPPPDVPSNARLVEWLSYSRTMPHADVVVCHGSHGTLGRALSYAKPVIAVPAGGDMAENAVRVQWSGAGVSLPGRLLSPTTLRWVVQRVLENPRYTERARSLGRWARDNDGAKAGAVLVEELAFTGTP